MWRLLLLFFFCASLFSEEYSVFDVNKFIMTEAREAKTALIAQDWDSYYKSQGKIDKYLSYGVFWNYPELANEILAIATQKGRATLLKVLPLVNKLAPSSGMVQTKKVSSLISVGLYKPALTGIFNVMTLLSIRSDYCLELFNTVIVSLGKGLNFAVMLIAICFLANNSEVFLTRLRYVTGSKRYFLMNLFIFALLFFTLLYSHIFIVIFITLMSFVFRELKKILVYSFIGTFLLVLGQFSNSVAKHWFDDLGYRSIYEIQTQGYISKDKFIKENNLVYWIKAQIFKSTGDFKLAEKFLDLNTSVFFSDYVNFERGNILYYQQKYKEADDSYKLGRPLYSMPYFYNLSKIKFKLKEVDQSFELLKKIKKLDKNFNISNGDENVETNFMLVEPLNSYLLYKSLITEEGFGPYLKKFALDIGVLIFVLISAVVFKFNRNIPITKSDFADKNWTVVVAILNILTPFGNKIKSGKFTLTIIVVVLLSIIIAITRLTIPDINLSQLLTMPIIILTLFIYLLIAFFSNLISYESSYGRR